MAVIKSRLCTEDEPTCRAGIELVELALPNAWMQSPGQGSNPKYADQQKWFAYGELDTSRPTVRRRRRKTAQ
jgi:hypothetical protein